MSFHVRSKGKRKHNTQIVPFFSWVWSLVFQAGAVLRVVFVHDKTLQSCSCLIHHSIGATSLQLLMLALSSPQVSQQAMVALQSYDLVQDAAGEVVKMRSIYCTFLCYN